MENIINIKVSLLLAVSSLSLGVLTACSSNEKKEETKTGLSAEVFTGATAGTTDFETLSKDLSKDGRWHAVSQKTLMPQVRH